MLETVKQATVHKVPKSINDCVKPDPISVTLWRWSQTIATWGICLVVYFILAGIVEGIAMASDNYSDRVAVFLAALSKGVISAIITYLSYNVLSLLIASLASIVQHTHSNAMLKEYELRGREPEVTAKKDIATVTETFSANDASVDQSKQSSGVDDEPFIW